MTKIGDKERALRALRTSPVSKPRPRPAKAPKRKPGRPKLQSGIPELDRIRALAAARQARRRERARRESVQD